MKKAMNNKKGFTLVEIIVVLVILAILAAVAIPSMVSFVNDARGKAYVAEARVGLAAAQAVVTELVASGSATSINATGGITGGAYNEGNVITHPTFVSMTADVENANPEPGEPGAGSNGFSSVTVDESNNRVTGITYNAKSGHIITIADGTTTVSKKTTETEKE